MSRRKSKHRQFAAPPASAPASIAPKPGAELVTPSAASPMNTLTRRQTFDRSYAPPDVIARADTAFNWMAYSRFMKILPNPDKQLKAQGLDQMTYQELKRFPIVKTCVTRRKYGVLKMVLDVNRDSGETVESKFIKEEVFAKLNMQRIISDILDAPQFGYRVQEVYWNERGGMMLPTDVKAKPNDWFGFDVHEMLRFKSKKEPIQGELLPGRKFLVTKHESDQYEKPYGEPILSSMFWNVHFMKGGMKLYMKFLQKYGIPYLHGKLPRGSQPEDTEEMLDYLDSLQQDGIVVTPNDQDISIVDVSGKASADLWRGLREDMRADIIELELGHEGAIVNVPGKLGSDDTALAVSKDIAEADANLVCETINKLIRWVIDANFWSPQDYPTVQFYAKENIDAGRALRDSYLMKDPRLAFTKTYYTDVYGFKDEHIEILATKDSAAPASADLPNNVQDPGDIQQAGKTQPTIVANTPVESFKDALTTPDQLAIDNAIKLMAGKSKDAVAEFIAPLIKMVNESQSFEEVNTKMKHMMGVLPDAELRNALYQAIFGAKVIGHASITLEHADDTK